MTLTLLSWANLKPLPQLHFAFHYLVTQPLTICRGTRTYHSLGKLSFFRQNGVDRAGNPIVSIICLITSELGMKQADDYCHECKISSFSLCSKYPVIWSLTAQTIACPGGIRISRGKSPLYTARMPSSLGIVTSACSRPRYLGCPSPRSCAINLVCTYTDGAGYSQTGAATTLLRQLDDCVFGACALFITTG